jgi:hypothetical protein
MRQLSAALKMHRPAGDLWNQVPATSRAAFEKEPITLP